MNAIKKKSTRGIRIGKKEKNKNYLQQFASTTLENRQIKSNNEKRRDRKIVICDNDS